MKRIGKTGRWKIAAKNKIKRMFFDHEIRTCEIKLEKCTGQMFATPAHRHKQEWYNYRPHDLYSSYSQVMWACCSCHQQIEYDAELTEEIFIKLRGEKA